MSYGSCVQLLRRIASQRRGRACLLLLACLVFSSCSQHGASSRNAPKSTITQSVLSSGFQASASGLHIGWSESDSAISGALERQLGCRTAHAEVFVRHVARTSDKGGASTSIVVSAETICPDGAEAERAFHRVLVSYVATPDWRQISGPRLGQASVAAVETDTGELDAEVGQTAVLEAWRQGDVIELLLVSERSGVAAHELASHLALSETGDLSGHR